MIAVEQHFGLDDRNNRGLLAQRSVARQRVGVGVQAGVSGSARADRDHGAPLGKAGAQLEVFGQPPAQSVEPLGDLLARAEREIMGALVHFDARDDPLFLEVARERFVACDRALAQGLVEENHAAYVLFDALGGKQQVAVGAAVRLGTLHADRLEAFLAGRVGFVRGEQSFALGDHGCRRLG